MALRWFFSNARSYATSTILLRWTSFTGTVLAATSYFGRNSLGLTGNASEFTNSVTKVIDGQSSWIVSFRGKITGSAISGAMRFLKFSDGGTDKVALGVNASGNFVLWEYDGGWVSKATGTAVMLTTDPVLFEFKVTLGAGTGSFTLKLNGRTDIAYTGNLSTGTTDRFTWGGIYNSGTTWHINDVAIADTSGSVNNDWLGDVRVDAHSPNANGTYQSLTRSNTGVNAYTLVDDEGGTEGDYVYSQTNGARSTFGCGALTHTPSTIYGVQLITAAVKTDPAPTSVKHLLVSKLTSPAVEVLGDAIALQRRFNGTTTLQMDGNTTLYETDPATGAPWTIAAYNAIEVGVEVVT